MNQQQTTKDYNNKQQPIQEATKQSNGWGVFIIGSFLVFMLLLVFVGFCLVFGASQQSTIKTTIYNKNSNIHNNQAGWGGLLFAHSWWFFFCLSWLDILLVL
jgi:hypothetical protein